MNTTDDQIEELGTIADTCDNLLGALELPLAPHVHIEQLKIALAELATKIKALVVAISGENPWDESGV